MALPVELIDHIFSFLQGNISALEACSKANSFCSTLAERYLYAHLYVGKNNSSVVYKQLSKNLRILDYLRTLELNDNALLSIMPMIPRMANLISLSLFDPLDTVDYDADFLPMLGSCLKQSAIEELCLYRFYEFPLSVLDHCKNIKKLILSDCTALEEPISSHSDFPHQSLQTLNICGYYNPGLLVWIVHRATCLTSLKLPCEDDRGWIPIPEILSILTAYSSCLTRLHLDVGEYCRSTFIPTRGRWINYHLELPFTLSALICLMEFPSLQYVQPPQSQPTTESIVRSLQLCGL